MFDGLIEGAEHYVLDDDDKSTIDGVTTDDKIKVLEVMIPFFHTPFYFIL